jgi:hypothetical protein
LANGLDDLHISSLSVFVTDFITTRLKRSNASESICTGNATNAPFRNAAHLTNSVNLQPPCIAQKTGNQQHQSTPRGRARKSQSIRQNVCLLAKSSLKFISVKSDTRKSVERNQGLVFKYEVINPQSMASWLHRTRKLSHLGCPGFFKSLVRPYGKILLIERPSGNKAKTGSASS